MDPLVTVRNIYATLLRLRRKTPNHRAQVLQQAIDGAAFALHELGGAQPCKGCSNPTIGVIGDAGIYWPFLCQDCKDSADTALLLRVAAIAGSKLPGLAKCAEDAEQVDPVLERQERALERQRDEDAARECDERRANLPLVITGPGGDYTKHHTPRA